MMSNALLATVTVFLALGLWLAEECKFLIPYRRMIWIEYAGALATFAAVLFFNIFVTCYVLCRKLFLKDTGRKLAHIEKQLRTDGSISEELSRRLEEK